MKPALQNQIISSFHFSSKFSLLPKLVPQWPLNTWIEALSLFFGFGNITFFAIFSCRKVCLLVISCFLRYTEKVMDGW